MIACVHCCYSILEGECVFIELSQERRIYLIFCASHVLSLPPTMFYHWLRSCSCFLSSRIFCIILSLVTLFRAASNDRMILWRRTGRTIESISSLSTYPLLSRNAFAFAQRIRAIEARGDAPDSIISGIFRVWFTISIAYLLSLLEIGILRVTCCNSRKVCFSIHL